MAVFSDQRNVKKHVFLIYQIINLMANMRKRTVLIVCKRNLGGMYIIKNQSTKKGLLKLYNKYEEIHSFLDS